MSKPRPEISVVIPAYNEEDCIGECLEEVRGVMENLGRSYEMIVVDDGSIDRTFEVLREKRASMPLLRAFRFASNRGQTTAMRAGFERARGELIVTMDADLQNDPADIPRLLSMMEGHDAVCGRRVKRADPLVKRVSSRVANRVRNWLTHENIQDTGCTLKVFRAECVKQLKLFDGMHRFLPTLLRLEGCRVAEMDVNHRPRRAGATKYNVRNRLFAGLRDLFAVRWMKRRWRRYEIEEEL